MSVIVRLQNLPWSAVAADIRQFFSGLSIPEGGVNIVGGELGDAFIAFSTDEDARQAMLRDGGKVKDAKVKLLLSSRAEMQKETARQQSLQMQYLQMQQLQSTQSVIAGAVAAPQASSATVAMTTAMQPAAYAMQPAQTLPTPTANLQAQNLAMQQQLQQQLYSQMLANKTEGIPQSAAAMAMAMMGASAMQFPPMSAFPMQQQPAVTTPTPTTCTPIASTANAATQPQVRLAQNSQPQLVPSFQTASAQMQSQVPPPYQMATPHLAQTPVSQPFNAQMQSHAPPVQAANQQHINQPTNFQAANQQMNVRPNYQSQPPQPGGGGFQSGGPPPQMNQPFQGGGPRMSQPPPFSGPNNASESNQQANFNQRSDAPPFGQKGKFRGGAHNQAFRQTPPQMGRGQGFQSAHQQPLIQRKIDNKSNFNDNRSRRSRSSSIDSSDSRSRSHSREYRGKDRFNDKDRRRRPSREFNNRRGRKDRSRSRERRSSRDRRRDYDRDDDSRRRDYKATRSTDPSKLYQEYHNPNSNFKSHVEPVTKSTMNYSRPASTAPATTTTKTVPVTTAADSQQQSSEKSAPDGKTDNGENETKANNELKTPADQHVSNSPKKAFPQNNNQNAKQSMPPSLANKSQQPSTSDGANRSSNDQLFSSKPPASNQQSNVNASSPAKRRAPGNDYEQRYEDYNDYDDYSEDAGFNQNKGFKNFEGREFDSTNRFNNNNNNARPFDEPKQDFHANFRPGNNRLDSPFGRANRFDSGNRFQQPNPPPNCCVFVQNFPIFNGYKDVIGFFHDLSPHMFVKLQRNENGRVNSAYVRFANYQDKVKSLKRDGFRLKKNVVSVKHVDDEVFDQVVDQGGRKKQNVSANANVNPNASVISTSIAPKENMRKFNPHGLHAYTCLVLEGEQGVDPVYDCKHVYHFKVRNVFNQINPVELFMQYNSYSTNRGFVKFENPSMAMSARNLLEGLTVDCVDIKIYPCTEDEFEKYKAIVEGKTTDDGGGENDESVAYNEDSKNVNPRQMNKDPRLNVDEGGVGGKRGGGLLRRPPMEPNSMPDLESDCIIMQGLPANVHYRDIVNFFNTINIQPTQIHVMVDNNGRPVGDAFCEFKNCEEAETATNNNNCQMLDKFVHVRLVPREELNNAVGKDKVQPPHLMEPQDGGMPMGGNRPPFGPGNRPPFMEGNRPPFSRDNDGFRGGMRGGHHMGRGGPPSMMHRGGGNNFGMGRRGGRGGGFIPPLMGGDHQHNAPPPNNEDNNHVMTESSVDSFGRPGCVVAAENIPFRADVNDIIHFFGDFQLVPESVIRRYNDNGQVTGDARIAFETPADARRAVKMYDQRFMFRRPISLHLVR